VSPTTADTITTGINWVDHLGLIIFCSNEKLHINLHPEFVAFLEGRGKRHCHDNRLALKKAIVNIEAN
jgi:hypothetical protein